MTCVARHCDARPAGGCRRCVRHRRDWNRRVSLRPLLATLWHLRRRLTLWGLCRWARYTILFVCVPLHFKAKAMYRLYKKTRNDSLVGVGTLDPVFSGIQTAVLHSLTQLMWRPDRRMIPPRLEHKYASHAPRMVAAGAADPVVPVVVACDQVWKASAYQGAVYGHGHGLPPLCSRCHPARHCRRRLGALCHVHGRSCR